MFATRELTTRCRGTAPASGSLGPESPPAPVTERRCIMRPDPAILDYPATSTRPRRPVRWEELRFFSVPCAINCILGLIVFAVPSVRSATLFGIVVAAFTLVSFPFVVLGTVCGFLSGRSPIVWFCFGVIRCCAATSHYGTFQRPRRLTRYAITSHGRHRRTVDCAVSVRLRSHSTGIGRDDATCRTLSSGVPVGGRQRHATISFRHCVSGWRPVGGDVRPIALDDRACRDRTGDTSVGTE